MIAHYPDHFWLLTTEADTGEEILAFNKQKRPALTAVPVLVYPDGKKGRDAG